jgi:predicted amidohydrolase
VTLVRLAAVSLRLDMRRAEDVGAFRAAVEEVLDRHVVAHPSAPTLVAFPEHTGLLAAFLGERGSAARASLAAGAPAVEALGELAGGHAEALDHYAARFPGVDSLGGLLQLALADTVLHGVHDTFADLAAERGLWLAVGAALPDWEVRDDPALRAMLDPDGAREHVYAATSAEVRNRNLVYAPDGTLAAVQDKAYLVPMERDRAAGLGLSACSLAEVGVADLPIGRLATVISKDAWMPDVNERLDQLRAQVLVQPEAFDRWGRVDRDGEIADLWPPDKFQRGGWWMLQRHRSLRVNLTPMLVGNLGDLAFDGQALIAVPAPGGEPGIGLLGQPADAGWAAVGGFNDLDESPQDLADPARRPEFEQLALRMAPGSGDPQEGAVAEDAVWADVTLPGPREPGPLPQGVDAAASVEVAPGQDTQLVPDLAAGTDRAWIAFVSCGRDPAQGVMVAEGDGTVWGAAQAVAPREPRAQDQFDRQWRPRLTVTDEGPVCGYLAFPHESWDVFVALPHQQVTASRVDDAHDDEGVLRERGHDALRLVAGAGELTAVWSDLRWPWVFPQVRVASSTDGGRTWGASRRVDGAPLEGEQDPLRPRSPHESHGQTAPAAVHAGGGLLVAWQERTPSGPAAIWTVRLDDGAPQRVTDTESACHRPCLAAAGDLVWLAWEQDDAADGGGLWWRLSVDAGTTWSPAKPLEPDLPAGVTQRAATLVPVSDRRAVAVWEDDRAGDGRILAALLGPDGASPPRRLCDTPPQGIARAPAAVVVGDRLVVAWQDTRAATEQVRTRAVPVAELLG